MQNVYLDIRVAKFWIFHTTYQIEISKRNIKFYITSIILDFDKFDSMYEKLKELQFSYANMSKGSQSPKLLNSILSLSMFNHLLMLERGGFMKYNTIGSILPEMLCYGLLDNHWNFDIFLFKSREKLILYSWKVESMCSIFIWNTTWKIYFLL